LSGQKTLFAQWVGELGVYLGWLAGVRHVAPLYDKVIVCAFSGWEALSADFADEFVPHDFQGVACGALLRGPSAPSEAEKLALCPEGAEIFPPVHTMFWGNVYDEPVGDRQTYVRHGKLSSVQTGDILLHARARSDWGGKRNWAAEKWAELSAALKPSARMLISIGTKDGALYVPGTVEARGRPLAELMVMMRNAALCVGPSSGPMHLAALCRCPHVVWFGGDENHLDDDELCERKQQVLYERYTTAWNPFRTPVAPIQARDWQPSVETVASTCHRVLDALSGPVSEAKAEAAIAIRHGYVNKHKRPKRPRLGICVLAYEQLGMVDKAVASIKRNTEVSAEICVFDNSEGNEIGAMLADKHRTVTYFKAPENLGCTKPRNWFLNYCRQKGYPHAIFMDQDVEVTAVGWARDMRKVVESLPDTGLVAWPLANSRAVFGGAQKPEHEADKTGCVLEVPGLCCLHNLEAFADATEKVASPYDERYFMWGFDTRACLVLRKAGWKTRLVTGEDKIKHDHPHSGVNLNPDRDRHRAHSRRLLRKDMFDLELDEVPGLM